MPGCFLLACGGRYTRFLGELGGGIKSHRDLANLVRGYRALVPELLLLFSVPFFRLLPPDFVRP